MLVIEITIEETDVDLVRDRRMNQAFLPVSFTSFLTSPNLA